MKQSLIFFLILISPFGIAQISDWQNPNFRTQKIQTQDSVVLDSLFILNDKFSLKNKNGELIPENAYRIDYEKSTIFFHQTFSDSLLVEYYVHPTIRKMTTSVEDPKLIVASTSEIQALVLDNQQEEKKEMFDGLNTQGSLVRGITFGNNQGSSVQSSLDLRVNGQLSDKVGVTAVIADTNVPIEADGYTQNLEQFDRVFVELFSDNTSARAGHIDLQQTDEYFGRFNRRVTGLNLQHNINGDSAVTHLQLAGSVSRGEFKQMKFNGQEGNQGPYRLSGNNGEAYVIVLSGSERVYLNGILLQRGENYDYVMNYNTGEIIFTNKHLIRATDRIIAEYQYTNRNYNRFLWYGGASHKARRFTLSGHVFSEGDNKNNPVNQNLNEEEIAILSTAGNDVTQMYAPTAQQVSFEEGKVLYKKILLGGVEVFEYSTNPNDELYEVGFSQLGANKGNYILSNTGVNGRVFEYVAPVAGVLQGDFEPVRLLVAPQKKQVISLAGSYDFKNNGGVELDAGISNIDQNLFSDVDDNENVGLALRLKANKIFQKGKVIFQPNVSYEFVQKNFSTIERLRKPEFAREFNLPNELNNFNQHFLQTNIEALLSDSVRLNYGFDLLNQTTFYKGNRHRINGMYKDKKSEFFANATRMHSETETEKTNFNQYEVQASRKLGKLKLGAGILGESNIRKIQTNDSLSFKWNEFFATAMLGDTINKYAYIRAYKRSDDSTKLQRLQKYSDAFGVEFNSRLIKTENQSLSVLTHYRNIKYADSLQNVSYLNATISYQKSLWNKAMDVGVNYEIAGGTELQRAFTYVQVADGLGIYKWLDYNEDGIQQLDEFEVAEFSDQANFIRVYTNTVNTIKTNSNRLSLSLRLNPARYFGKDTFWKRISSNAVYSTFGKYLKNDKVAEWNPWSLKNDVRSEVEQFYWQTKYNQGREYKWKATHEFNLQQNTQFIFTGLEGLKTKSNKLAIQYKINDFMNAEFSNRFDWVESFSDAFQSKRFKLKGYDVVPKLYFNWSEKLKSSLAYVHKNQENTRGLEQLKAHQLNFDFNWNDSEKNALLLNFDWVKNDFIGNPDSVVGNRMMEGLRDGNNLVWQLLFQRSLNSYLELNLQYSGRKSEDFDAIHTGSVQVRVKF